LTAEERELLKDPDWIDEDEADLILAMRTDSQTSLSDGISLPEHRVRTLAARRSAVRF